MGLDPKDLTAKGKSAEKQLKDLEAQTTKVGKSGGEATKSLEDMTRGLGRLFAVLGGSYAIKAFITDTINSNAALDRLSKNLGLNVETVSAWGNAVEEVGGSAKGLQGTLSRLSKEQTNIRLTGESSLIPFFARLGVNIGAFGQKVRPVDEILLDLADRFSKLDRTQANNLGGLIGIDQDTLNLLLQGRQAVELQIKRQKEHNAVTKAEAEQDAKWQRQIVDLNQTLNKFGRDLLQEAAPAINTLIAAVSKFGDWVHANKQFIGDFLKVMAVGLGAIAVLTAPIDLTVLSIIALGLAIALLWQDYQKWKAGGNSFIDWKVWEDRINAVKDALKKLREEFEKSAAYRLLKKQADESKDLVPSDDVKKKRLKRFFGIRDNSSPSTGDGSTAAIARQVAKKVAAQTGISEDILFAQFQHETGNFTNRGSTSLNNFSGINVPGGNGKQYRKFDSPDAYANYYANLLKSRYPGALGAQDTDTFAKGLKGGTIGPYFTDSIGNYEKGINNALRNPIGSTSATAGIRGASSTIAQAKQPGTSAGTNDNSTSVQTGDINIFTNARDAKGIAGEIKGAVNYLFTAQSNPGLT